MSSSWRLNPLSWLLDSYMTTGPVSFPHEKNVQNTSYTPHTISPKSPPKNGNFSGPTINFHGEESNPAFHPTEIPHWASRPASFVSWDFLCQCHHGHLDQPAMAFPEHPSKQPQLSTLPKTNIATRNGWLEDESSFWEGLFSEAMLVSGSVYIL